VPKPLCRSKARNFLLKLLQINFIAGGAHLDLEVKVGCKFNLGLEHGAILHSKYGLGSGMITLQEHLPAHTNKKIEIIHNIKGGGDHCEAAGEHQQGSDI